mmetsp:Transcript_74242/g.91168  ORF Transcript_74242/g.91168 Transcript_74242/m.91168 type:complete len:330 (+) Transcript_74242:60-1049(+)|eukprot:CAMPEP_0114678702 /NCGR_PEP_ID=MMETSP0191-20121206/52079_1 /TAXON_ID=126664 /ORGANISM="Sorites sp." /LENGTH=329 /DNA_ID=CAMNT_0001953123 /DNA_START=42 /DNA_END=1031 /DNA_ORIENTATION=-
MAAMAECGIQTLANIQMLPFALKFCSGTTLSMLRAASSMFSEAIPESSVLWEELLFESPAWLHDGKTSTMQKAQRLSAATERCKLDRVDATAPTETPVSKSQRYRLIVTGARRSGISTLVRLMARRDELESHQGKDMSLMNFSAELSNQKLSISAVDKRSTAIVTPLSAALYNGHTAALFVFDASCMEDSLTKAAWCISELRQTVGLKKFRLMPKLLVCHKADLLPKEAPQTLLQELPPMCEALLMNYGMDLIFTSREDPSSVDMAVALAAERWPETDPDDASRKFPTISRQQLRPTRTVVRRNTVVNLQPRRPANILEELRARVPRVD